MSRPVEARTKVFSTKINNIVSLDEHGKDIKTFGGRYGNALDASKQDGALDTEVVELLLERGVDI